MAPKDKAEPKPKGDSYVEELAANKKTVRLSRFNSRIYLDGTTGVLTTYAIRKAVHSKDCQSVTKGNQFCHECGLFELVDLDSGNVVHMRTERCGPCDQTDPQKWEKFRISIRDLIARFRRLAGEEQVLDVNFIVPKEGGVGEEQELTVVGGNADAEEEQVEGSSVTVDLNKMVVIPPPPTTARNHSIELADDSEDGDDIDASVSKKGKIISSSAFKGAVQYAATGQEKPSSALDTYSFAEKAEDLVEEGEILKALYTLKLNPPLPVTIFVVISNAIHDNAPNYDFLATNCYYFTFMVMAILESLGEILSTENLSSQLPRGHDLLPEVRRRFPDVKVSRGAGDKGCENLMGTAFFGTFQARYCRSGQFEKRKEKIVGQVKFEVANLCQIYQSKVELQKAVVERNKMKKD